MVGTKQNDANVNAVLVLYQVGMGNYSIIVIIVIILLVIIDIV